MAEFVLKNNLFEFNSKVFQQISGTAIDTKFAPPRFFRNKRITSIVVAEVHWRHFFHFDSWKGRIKKVYGVV